MSDPYKERAIARGLEQTRVIERPGGVSGYDAFYQTGTWTPTYFGNTTAGVTTYSFQVGGWVRIGKLAVVTGLVVWTAATGTGNANFGLPFTSENVTNQFFSGSVRVDSVTFANSAPQIVLSPNLAFFNLVSPLTNAASTTVAMEAAGNVVFTISYFIQ